MRLLSLLPLVHLGAAQLLGGYLCIDGLFPCRAGNTCVVTPPKRVGRCVADPLALGDACEGRPKDCPAGLACRPETEGAPPTCQRPMCDGRKSCTDAACVDGTVCRADPASPEKCCFEDGCRLVRCMAGSICEIDSLGSPRCRKSCETTCGQLVPHGWAGADDGSNGCNTCFCSDGGMICTKRACPRLPCPGDVCKGRLPCGGFAGLACAGEGQVCVDDPTDGCNPAGGGADCVGCCVAATCAATRCPEGKLCQLDASGAPVCVDRPSICCLPPLRCPAGTEMAPSCADDELEAGTCAFHQICCDRFLCRAKPAPPAVCEGKKFCGGIAGLLCASGETCIDIPDDGCDVKTGGRDCGGCCVADRCPSTRCPEGKLCQPDATGAPACVDTPRICCLSPLRCPEGTEMTPSCKDEELEAGTCEFHQICCDRFLCRAKPAPPAVCEGKKSCGGIAGLLCGSGETCIDVPNDGCDVKTGGRDCGGCCVADTCPSTVCEGGLMCTLDAQAAAMCPGGTEMVTSCSDAEFASGECHFAQMCCSRVLCRVVAEEPRFCVDKEPCSPGAKVSPCGPSDVCLDDPDDACDPASDAECPGCCALNMCQTAKCSAGYSCHLDERGNARCLADCASTCGAPVRHGWAGSDDGSNACNLCSCHDGSMTCTKEACPKATCPYCAGKSTCGGKLGACRSQGTVCKDDPSDKCDPMKGGKDCTGCCEMNPCFATDCKQGYTCTVNAAGWAECKQDCETTCGRRVGHGYNGPDDGPNECNRCTCDDGVFGSCTELLCDGGSCPKVSPCDGYPCEPGTACVVLNGSATCLATPQ
ncbi:hypothetical protein DIPPA_28910 [Diplonema papillatum]|nr:hypothetical protein DIPPA_28910 [Diplonema papillatum]